MSADNAIIILHLTDRSLVAHIQAFDDLFYSVVEWKDSPFLVPTRVVEMLHDAKQAFEYNAKDIAMAMEQEIESWGYLEYGIIEYTLNKSWREVCKEAWELLPLEINSVYSLPEEKRIIFIKDLLNLAKILESEELKLQGV